MESFSPVGIVTLLTDFGLADTYVGQMKGVLLGIEPTLRIVDLTHEVAPQDIEEGAFQLATAVEAFPAGCVHVAVVDPGVGTSRRAIVVETSERSFVAPDNGVLSYVIDDAIAAFDVSGFQEPGRPISTTFHGRDIFAPVAGRLASARDAAASIGPAISVDSLVRLPDPVVPGESVVVGRIVSIDHFGNCLTMIGRNDLTGPIDDLGATCGCFHVDGLRSTYGDVEPGRPVALIGSHGGVELAVRNGSAAMRYGLARGDRVEIRQTGR